MAGMIPREAGRGERVSYPTYDCGSTRIEWFCREADGSERVRTPEPCERVYPDGREFSAAGKSYANLGMLAGEGGEPLRRDAYGREVLCLRERFPCFDSYDFLHEKRFFRWFFLREGGRLTRVYHADETLPIYVTEDVRDVEDGCWKRMKELGFFPEP